VIPSLRDKVASAPEAVDNEDDHNSRKYTTKRYLKRKYTFISNAFKLMKAQIFI
jgi:hypothetical protein